MRTIKNQALHLVQKLTSSRLVMVFAVMAAVVSVATAVAAAQAITNSQAAYREQLRNQVQNTDGAPRTGHDPITSEQTSLASAASRPTSAGPGAQVDKPAANVAGEHKHVQPSQVLPDPKKTGVLSNGCLADYGVPGQDCIQAGLVSNGKSLSCTDVRKQFPQGVTISGTDRYKLDKNANKTACDAGDAR